MREIIYTSDKINPYVYILVHKITKEFYIGSRWTKLQKYPSHIDIFHYKTSSRKIKPIFDEFDVYILAEFYTETRYDDVYDFEQFLINEHWGDPLLINKSNCYGNEKRFRTEYEKQSEEESKIHRERISKAVKAHWDNKSEEEIQEFKDRTSKQSKEIWANKSEEERKALGDKIRKGILSKSDDDWNEYVTNISNSVKMECEIDGIIYDSRYDASRALNIRVGIIRKRLFSDKFPAYKDLSGKGIRKTKKVYIHGIVYSSLRKAQDGTNIKRGEIKRIIENKENPNMYFIE